MGGSAWCDKWCHWHQKIVAPAGRWYVLGITRSRDGSGEPRQGDPQKGWGTRVGLFPKTSQRIDAQVLSRHPTSLLLGEGFLGWRKAPCRSSELAGSWERPSRAPSQAWQPIKLGLMFLAPGHVQLPGYLQG